ncbi:hypothetical protein NQZ79_g94 [Umbelopsis isabellina]|nr:hypothetical protein NQZ79_g94 [Umbelopsis isabellina]
MPFGFFSSQYDDQGIMDDGMYLPCLVINFEKHVDPIAPQVTGSSVVCPECSVYRLLERGNTSAFAVIYSIGNIVSLFSMTFVVGIPKQLKTMFAPVRFWATVVYIALLALTLAMSLWLHNFILSIILVIIQFGALVWYA